MAITRHERTKGLLLRQRSWPAERHHRTSHFIRRLIVRPSGWRVSGHDAILLSLNGYEIKVRVHGDGQYNFDANRFDGSWHLTCCSHWSEEEIRERETSRR